MPEYPITAQSAYFANIAKIINYFRHTKGSGFLFCACNSQALVQEINRQILEKAKAIGLKIAEVYLTSEHTENSLDPIRAAAEQKPDGIILNNLNELVMRSNGAFVREINFAREILIDLEVPLLFWLSEENMSRFANDAADLFSRKDRGIVHFTALSGNTAMDRFQDDYFEQYRQTEDYNSLKLKIELLEKQLKEAEEKKYSPKRIANEIVADLIKLYVDAYLRNEAWALFEKYGEYLIDDLNHLELIGDLYNRREEWGNSLAYYSKFEHISIELKNRLNLGRIYSKMGRIYRKIGEWNNSLEYLLKSEQIETEIGDRQGLGYTYCNIGFLYYNKGELDKALEYFVKNEQISLEVGNLNLLGWSYGGIGVIYSKKNDWDKAVEYYLKSNKICLETGELKGLSWTYNNIGETYIHKNELDKAFEYFYKSEQIRLEIGARSGLAFTYFTMGTIYLEKNNKSEANPYLILAGYIAKTLGMKHEFSKWSEVLNPLIEEMGEDRFMETGKKLCAEKGIAV